MCDFAILILRVIAFVYPLKVFILLGAVLVTAGLVKLICDVTLANLSEIAVLVSLGALIIWTVGLLTDQNARISRRTSSKTEWPDETPSCMA